MDTGNYLYYIPFPSHLKTKKEIIKNDYKTDYKTLIIKHPIKTNLKHIYTQNTKPPLTPIEKYTKHQTTFNLNPYSLHNKNKFLLILNKKQLHCIIYHNLSNTMKIQYYETLVNNNFSKIRIEMFKHFDIMSNEHLTNLQYVQNNVRNAAFKYKNKNTYIITQLWISLNTHKLTKNKTPIKIPYYNKNTSLHKLND